MNCSRERTQETVLIGITTRPLESVSAVARYHVDRIAIGINAAVRRRLAFLPGARDVTHEMPESFDAVTARPFQEGVDLGGSPRTAIASARGEDRTDAKTLDGFGEEELRRRRARLRLSSCKIVSTALAPKCAT
jgi:hypothetical protein